MFTGLIEAVGRLRERESVGGDVRLVIDMAGLPRAGLSLGESIAVNGVCLTVVAFDTECFSADVSNETLSRTTLGALQAGAPVNLERALRADARLGGHLVSGHVDGVGSVVSVDDDARSQRWRFRAPADLMRFIAGKGSICIDGTSLTVNAVGADTFDVNLVPHTVSHTAFSAARPGQAVNLEVDLVARYVERLLAHRDPAAGDTR